MPDEVSLLERGEGGGLVIVPVSLKKSCCLSFTPAEKLSGIVVYSFDKNLLFYMLHVAKSYAEIMCTIF